MNRFDAEHVRGAWTKAIERRASDPEGAITMARTLLESVCKHILEEAGDSEHEANPDLNKLYKQTASLLNLTKAQHEEVVFKQILGGCTAVVEGLGSLRNRLSDAHGVAPMTQHTLAEIQARIEANYTTDLAQLPAELYPVLEQLADQPRYSLVGVLAGLSGSTSGALPYELGLAEGMILAAVELEELTRSDYLALHLFVRSLEE